MIAERRVRIATTICRVDCINESDSRFRWSSELLSVK
jgi:hypothetical protein